MVKRLPRLGRSAGSSAPDDGVVRITSTATSHSDDVAERTRRYLIQMSIRVVCFVGAVAIDHWSRWLLLLGAVVLPYVAVVMANAGSSRASDPGTYLPPPRPLGLPGPAPHGPRP
ncbi:MAG: hypothetical protein JWP95_1264 [Actinotalea sp.]|nr:hypothetical protein [Actinotalea sp.]